MSNLIIKIKDDLKSAMVNKEAIKVSTLRMLLAAIHNKEIELLKKEEGLSDEEIMSVIRSEVKKRKDAVSEFEKAGRSELVEEEKNELVILQSYLPPEISDEELSNEVKKVISETGAAGPADFGKVMKIISSTLKGKASGSRIAEAVKKELGNA